MKKSNITKLDMIQVKALDNELKQEIIEKQTNPYEVIKEVIELYKMDYKLLTNNKKPKQQTVDNFLLWLEAKSDLFSKGNVEGITVS